MNPFDWATVKALVERMGGQATLSTFDAGQTARIKVPGQPFVSFTGEWGDIPASEQAARWLASVAYEARRA